MNVEMASGLENDDVAIDGDHELVNGFQLEQLAKAFLLGILGLVRKRQRA